MEILLVVESCDKVLWMPGRLCSSSCALLNGYRHGEFGASLWYARLSFPEAVLLVTGVDWLLVLEERRRNIRPPNDVGGSSRPLALLFLFL